MNLVEIEQHFTVRHGQGLPLDLHDRGEAVMEQLVKLSDSGIIVDSSVGVDGVANVVEITVTVECDDLTEAVVTGVTAMRNAIHSAGDATPGWPSNKAIIEAVSSTLRAERVPA